MSSPAGAPVFLTQIAAAVEARLAALLDAESDRWTALDRDLEGPLSSLRALVLAGGKRLRAAFCHWTFVGLGGAPDDSRIVDAGAALELLHTSALIHDDIIDSSERRRGVDTVHVDFARRHRVSGWRGAPSHFGESAAILVGNLAGVYADTLLASAPKEAQAIFHQLKLEVNVGQYLDLLGTAGAEATPGAARRICQYKSGRYTVERPMHLGAALRAPERLARLVGPLTEYGMPLGEAFQLRDDLLGTFGDTGVTGKPVGEDLREGKPTLLYALARQRACGHQARLLSGRYGAPDLAPEEVQAIQAVFEDTGARAEVEQVIADLVDRSRSAVGRLPLTGDARDALSQLATFVMGRNY